MSVQININGESAKEAVQELTDLATHFTPALAKTIDEATAKVRPSSEDQPKDGKPEKQTSKSKEEDKPAKEEEKQEAETDNAEAASDVPKPEDLREKVSEKIKAGTDRAEIKSLLTEFGAKNASAVPKEKRAAFMAKLEEL